jgi:protein-disulfide isomerase
MKICFKNWFFPITIMALVSCANHSSYADPVSHSESNLIYSLTEEDVRRIVREELASVQNKIEKQDLASLLEEYKLADTSASSMNYGNKSARFSLQMFSDVECPFCRQMYFDIKKVVDNSRGVINWEYKHFPLSSHNPAAAIEAQAIECIASDQGVAKAWVALDQFIKSTQGNGKGIQQDLPDFVRSFGLNGSLLKNCLLADESKIKVNEDFKLGSELGVTGTPAVLLKDNLKRKDYLIKGKKSAEQLLQAIQSVM